MSHFDHDVVILGGGHNGLVAAAYLARAGLDVLVLERRPILGGACVTEELFPGYRFSACSYICYLFQDRIIDELELRRHGFRVYPIDPWRFLPLPDGSRLLLWNDLERTQAEIGRFSTADAAAYARWNAFWERAARIQHAWFFSPPPTLPQLAASFKTADDARFFERLLSVSMRDVVCEFFESEIVRAAVIHAHDVGDPNAPGSAWCYAYIKCSMLARPENVGLVHGGMGGITQALAAGARAHGARIRTSSPAQRVLVRDQTALGVRLEDGSEIRARAVVSNADPKRTFLHLVGPEHLPSGLLTSARQSKTQAAYLKFHAALKATPDCSRFFPDSNPAFNPRFLAEVKICPSMDYYERAWQDARRGECAREPVMEVQMPTAYDTSLAPPGHHVLSVWGLYAPVRPRVGSWDGQRQETGERLIDALSAYAPNFRDTIVHWSLFTPHDLEARIGFTDGNIRHLDMIPSQWLAQRPWVGMSEYRTPIANLYLCGAGTHPGGDVTGAPGHNAAHSVLRDLRA